MIIQEIEKEQRTFVRIPNSIRINIGKIIYPLPQSHEAEGIGKNISEGGVCFSSLSSYQPGTKLNLKMEIKGWKNYKKSFSMIFDGADKAPLSVIAEVVWCTTVPAGSKHKGSEYEIGVKFLDIYEDDYH
ncbi:MAG: PilZ domain-containing protein, partial [Desulfosarcina sp.]|nr:PilZ domain-containing protein [Desulfobacterales bacterium]